VVEVNFVTGVFSNLTRGRQRHYAPLPAPLLDVVRSGGWEESFRRRLASRRLS
jgi:hypothetical protein